jgi:hypothetical protein
MGTGGPFPGAKALLFWVIGNVNSLLTRVFIYFRYRYKRSELNQRSTVTHISEMKLINLQTFLKWLINLEGGKWSFLKTSDCTWNVIYRFYGADTFVTVISRSSNWTTSPDNIHNMCRIYRIHLVVTDRSTNSLWALTPSILYLHASPMH